MKRILAVLFIVMLLPLAAAVAEAPEEVETIAIINKDRTNVRYEDGKAFARLSCYTPVTVIREEGGMTYIIYPKALTELVREAYTLGEYKDAYTGVSYGWVNSGCISYVEGDRDKYYHKAEECRFSFYVEGIYHEMRGTRTTESKNYPEHKVPTINGKAITAHTNYKELKVWNVQPTPAP